MIIDRLENWKNYKSVHPGMAEAFAFLEESAREPKAPGHYELDGDTLFANIFEFEPKQSDDPQFEAHENYIDVQCILAGSELHYYAPKCVLCETVPYDGARDIAFYKFDEQGTRLALGENTFAIYFPQDGHLPSVPDGIAKKVCRAVVKVKL